MASRLRGRLKLSKSHKGGIAVKVVDTPTPEKKRLPSNSIQQQCFRDNVTLPSDATIDEETTSALHTSLSDNCDGLADVEVSLVSSTTATPCRDKTAALMETADETVSTSLRRPSSSRRQLLLDLVESEEESDVDEGQPQKRRRPTNEKTGRLSDRKSETDSEETREDEEEEDVDSCLRLRKKRKKEVTVLFDVDDLSDDQQIDDKEISEFSSDSDDFVDDSEKLQRLFRTRRRKEQRRLPAASRSDRVLVRREAFRKRIYRRDGDRTGREEPEYVNLKGAPLRYIWKASSLGECLSKDEQRKESDKRDQFFDGDDADEKRNTIERVRRYFFESVGERTASAIVIDPPWAQWEKEWLESNAEEETAEADGEGNMANGRKQNKHKLETKSFNRNNTINCHSAVSGWKEKQRSFPKEDKENIRPSEGVASWFPNRRERLLPMEPTDEARSRSERGNRADAGQDLSRFLSSKLQELPFRSSDCLCSDGFVAVWIDVPKFIPLVLEVARQSWNCRYVENITCVYPTLSLKTRNTPFFLQPLNNVAQRLLQRKKLQERKRSPRQSIKRKDSQPFSALSVLSEADDSKVAVPCSDSETESSSSDSDVCFISECEAPKRQGDTKSSEDEAIEDDENSEVLLTQSVPSKSTILLFRKEGGSSASATRRRRMAGTAEWVASDLRHQRNPDVIERFPAFFSPADGSVSRLHREGKVSQRSEVDMNEDDNQVNPADEKCDEGDSFFFSVDMYGSIRNSHWKKTEKEEKQRALNSSDRQVNTTNLTKKNDAVGRLPNRLERFDDLHRILETLLPRACPEEGLPFPRLVSIWGQHERRHWTTIA